MARAAAPAMAAAMLVLLAAGMPLAAADAADAPRQLVTLRNGDTISGTVTGFTAGGPLTLISPLAAAPILLKPAAVGMIDALAPCVPLPACPARITFSDGDAVPADVVGFDGASLTLTSPILGGQTTVNWQDVARIDFNRPAGTAVLSGPLASQPWMFGKPRLADTGKDAPTPVMPWKIEHGCLVGKGQGGAAIDTALPAKAEIALDYTSANALPVTIGLFTDAMLPASSDAPDGPRVIEKQSNPAAPFLEGLAIEISAQTVILRLHNHGPATEHLGSKRLPPALRDKEKRKLVIRLDAGNGSIGIWDHGQLMAKWTDLQPFAFKGKAITVSHAAVTGTMTLRRLEAREWTGTMDDDAIGAEPGKDVVIVKDGSRLTGKLGTFKNKLWHLHGGVGELELAATDIRLIVRAGPATDPGAVAPAGTAAMKVSLGDGHSLRLANPTLDSGGTLAGAHTPLGKITLPLASVDTLVFPVPPSPATP